VDDLKKPLTASASWRIHAGWEAVYTKYHGDVRTSPPKYALEEEGEWNISKSEENPLMVTDETKPPKRFSESSIVQEMKKAEIGRPSTYVSTVSKLSTKKYIKVEGSSLIPTEKGRMLWLDVVPFYNEQENSEKLFTPLFTSKMEDNLNGIEHGRINGPEVWTDFVEEFRSMHSKAQDKKREFPTPKQMALLESRIPHLNDKRRDELLLGKSLSELTGDDARRIIEQLYNSEEDNGHLPPSEKQTNLIVKLSDQAGLELDATLEKVGVKDISELTGGREGTASELISLMIENSKNLPATPPQVDLVNKLSEQYEIPLSEVLAIAGLKDISEMSKADASIIINEMKKRSRRRGSKRS
jgi:hypothetical protein